MQKFKHPLCLTALLCALVGLLSLLPCLLSGRGLLYYGDYFRQYLPFLQETRRMLLSGSYSWSWNTFLGDSFYGAYSYYTVANPFAYLALLFPDSLLLYGTLAAQLVKFAVSGICCSLYLRRFVRDDHTVLLGALLYTFSGFTIINNNYYFFLDVIAVFPLLLLGIELVGTQRDRRSCLILALAVFVNAIVNYYFLVSSCFLCLIYLVLRFGLLRLPKGGLALLGRLCGSAALGAGMAGFLLLPSAWKILHTPKATGSLGSLHWLPYSLGNLFERIRIFFMPIENNIEHAFYRSGSWTSTAVYLAVFGSLFVLLFVAANRKSWLTKTIAVLVVCLFIPVLNGLFSLFSDFSYTRWLYGLVLLLDLATVIMLERREMLPQAVLRRWYRISVAVMLLLSVPPALVCVLERLGISTIFSRLYDVSQSTVYAGLKGIAVSFALTAVNYALLALFVYRPRLRANTVLAAVCAACVLNYGGYLVFYNYINADTLDGYLSELSMLEEQPDTSYSYRTDCSASNQNLSLYCNMPSVSSYHSLQNENSMQFAVAAGYTDTTTTIVLNRPDQDAGALDTLLSVRYYIDVGNDSSDVLPEGFSPVSGADGIVRYENDNYLPMGFCYDGYITQEAAENSSLSQTKLMLLGLVVDSETADTVSDILPALDVSSLQDSDFDLAETAAARREQCTTSFAGTSSGFSAAITLDSDNYVFFSVPNDDGWEATVNGQSVSILTVNNGLCAVRCGAGDSEIVFTYRTPLLRTGCLVSAAALLLFAALALFPRKKH